MTHYMVELALWTLLLYVIGCVIGSTARSILRGKARN